MFTKESRQIVRASRHRFEWFFFSLSALITVSMLVGALVLTVYKPEVRSFLEESAITEFRDKHPARAQMTDQQVLAALSDEDREWLEYLEYAEWWLVLLAPLGLLLLIIYEVGKVYGEIVGGGIRVTPTQFPRVHAIWSELAHELGMKKVPPLYLKNGDGTLNAFVSCVPGYRPFGCVYSDIVERTLARDDERSLRFILGHELGHIRLRHVAWWYLMLNALSGLPILNELIGSPMARAREYGSDKIGMALSGDHECRGLLMLSAGKHLYQDVDVDNYEEQHINQRSLWVVVHNAHVGHPVVSWRIAALRQKRHGDLLWPRKVKAKTGTA